LEREKERDHYKDLDIGWRIILTLILKSIRMEWNGLDSSG
jgi:hypothetical protein